MPATEEKAPRLQEWIMNGVVCVMFIYHFIIAFIGLPEPLSVRSIHVSFVLFLGLLRYRASSKNKSSRVPWYDWILAACGIASAIYIHLEYDALLNLRMTYFDPLSTSEWIIGIMTLVLLLELTRRAIGPTLPLLVLATIIHSVLGPYFPGMLRHPGIPLRHIIDHLFLTTNGLYGALTSVSLAELFMFITFGALFQISGGERFLTLFAENATKNMIGGPAKSAVIGSALFGCISGSGAANVYATGTVTIPMMIKAGFKAEFAAAVEACASTLGQIIPPVMGASAFLIAELASRSYMEVAGAAILPSIFYVYALFIAVHLEARKMGIGVMKDAGNNPSMKRVMLDYCHLLIPVFILIYFLASRRTAYYASTMATLSILIIPFFRATTRYTFANFFTGIRSAVWRLISVSCTMLCAGVAVAVLQTTGVPFRLSGFIIQLAQGNLFLTLVMVAITVIILGMGLPISGAFLITALFGAPALIELGVQPFVAYMFIFMFALTSNITPPVCLSTFAAASIAGTPFMRTGIRGVVLGIASYIIPFMVIYNPTLLSIFDEGLLFAAQSFFSTILGITAFVIGVSGLYMCRLGLLSRLILLSVGLGLIWPGTISDLIGLFGFGLVTLWQLRLKKAEAAESIAG